MLSNPGIIKGFCSCFQLMVFKSLKFFCLNLFLTPSLCVYVHMQNLICSPICQAGNAKTRGPGHPRLQESALILDALVYTEAKGDLTCSFTSRLHPFVDLHHRSGHQELLKMKSLCLGRCFQVSAFINGAEKLC